MSVYSIQSKQDITNLLINTEVSENDKVQILAQFAMTAIDDNTIISQKINDIMTTIATHQSILTDNQAS